MQDRSKKSNNFIPMRGGKGLVRKVFNSLAWLQARCCGNASALETEPWFDRSLEIADEKN